MVGTENLEFIDCNVDEHIYLNIIKDNIYSNAQKLNLGESFIFQQDNNPKHTARKLKEWRIYMCLNNSIYLHNSDMNSI